MENLRDNLLLLCSLQEKDTYIVELKNKLEELPKSVERKKQELESMKTDFENKRTEYVRLNSLKKEKEAVLADREDAIAKHTASLNTVKSNDVYKTCLLQIEKAKADKSAVEDEILQLMENIEKENVSLKQYETDFKKAETEINAEIKNIESSSAKIKENMVEAEKERNEFAKNIDKNILTQYERIRENRNGQGLSLIDGDSCGGCNMILRPQLINQATKCQEIVYCDNCSRILFNKKEII